MQSLSQHDKVLHTPYVQKEQANAVADEATGQLLEYRHLVRGPDAKIWKKAFANDLGRLAQGVGTRMRTGTNTVFFVHPSNT